MTIHIHYKKGKVLQALRYHFIARNEIKVMLIAVNVFAFLSASLFAFHVVRATPFLISSLLWFILMLTFWFILPYLVYMRSATFKEVITLNFRQEAILLATSRGNTSWFYTKFGYFIESPHFFHLYINEKSFFLIPKDDCTGEADTLTVRAFLQEKIGKKK